MIEAAILAVALTLPSSAAIAARVSSHHGNGTQQRSVTYNNGAKVTGNLKSKFNNTAVYYEGRTSYSKATCASKTVGRYSKDTKSRSFVSRGGTIASTPGFGCSKAKVQSRISKNIKYRPDPSGNWSSKY